MRHTAVAITSFFFLSFATGLSAQEKLRVISLAPATTEILFALGLDEEIVGVSQFCSYPAQARKKAKVGSFSQPSLEKIVALRPEIIFCTGLEQVPVIAKLRQLGLAVCVSDPKNFYELCASIAEIGRLVHRQTEATALISTMKAKLSVLEARVAAVPITQRPKVFVEIWYDPLTTGGKGSFLDELINVAGGINIAHGLRTPYGSFSAEQVLGTNPDYIILAYMAKGNPTQEVSRRFGWERLTAVKSGHVYSDIDPNLLLRPGPRLVEGAEELHKRLYP